MAPQSSTLAWRVPWTEELGQILKQSSGYMHKNTCTLYALYPDKKVFLTVDFKIKIPRDLQK